MAKIGLAAVHDSYVNAEPEIMACFSRCRGPIRIFLQVGTRNIASKGTIANMVEDAQLLDDAELRILHASEDSPLFTTARLESLQKNPTRVRRSLQEVQASLDRLESTATSKCPLRAGSRACTCVRRVVAGDRPAVASALRKEQGMSAWVAGAVLLSALVHAGWNTLIKGRGTPFVNLVALSLGWVVLSPMVLWWAPLPEPAAWPYLLASVVVHVAYVGLLSAAYSHGDLGAVYPIVRGAPPLLVAVACWLWLGEPLGALGWIGVLGISVGLLALGAHVGSRPGARAMVYACAAALTVAGYTVLDGVGARAAGTALGYVGWMSALQGALFAFGALAWRRGELWAPLQSQLPRGLMTGVLAAGGYAVALWAMRQAPIALVAALRETSVVFGAAFAAFVLHESFGRRRLVAAALVAAGAACIQLAG